MFVCVSSGAVGKPFPTVEVCIGKPNVYSKNGYDIIALGNGKRTTIKDGMWIFFASNVVLLLFSKFLYESFRLGLKTHKRLKEHFLVG